LTRWTVKFVRHENIAICQNIPGIWAIRNDVPKKVDIQIINFLTIKTS
jgi:hypothetical protein